MIRLQHRLKRLESEQTLGDGEGQVSLAGCRPWGHRESDVVQKPPKKGEEQSKSCFRFQGGQGEGDLTPGVQRDYTAPWPDPRSEQSAERISSF